MPNDEQRKDSERPALRLPVSERGPVSKPEKRNEETSRGVTIIDFSENVIVDSYDQFDANKSSNIFSM